MQTIKELSTLLNISKVSVYKILKRDDVSPHVFKKNGITVVDEIGVSIIRANYNCERETAVNNTLKDSLTENTQGENIDIITFLQEQLQEKDNQINSLLNIIDNQQKLQTMPLLVSPEEKKLGFFARLFQRRKK